MHESDILDQDGMPTGKRVDQQTLFTELNQIQGLLLAKYDTHQMLKNEFPSFVDLIQAVANMGKDIVDNE